MAEEDLDNMPTGVRQAGNPVTAGEQLEGFGESVVDTRARDAAAAAGVKFAAFINYDVALDNYQDRDDIEPLAEKNARDMPADFADASFMRTVDGEAGTGSSA